MPFQPDPNAITWRLHLRATPQIVYAMLATDAGRARVWAEEAVEHNIGAAWHEPFRRHKRERHLH